VRVALQSADGVPLVEVDGEIDVDTAPLLDSRLREVVEGGATSVTVDLRRVGFLDATGLTALVRAHRQLATRAGSLDVVASEGAVLRVLAVAGLDRVFRIHALPPSGPAARPAGRGAHAGATPADLSAGRGP